MGRWDNAVYDVYVTDVCIVFGMIWVVHDILY
jgi:hypothetical protein